MMNPIDNIEWIDVERLQANDYNPNVVLTPEMKLLKRSILKTGWIQPILVNKDYIIIDGFHRTTLAKMDKEINELTGGKVPCVVMDLSDNERKCLTIRINRAKGNHISYKMSDVVKQIYENGMSKDEICGEIGATMEEVDLLLEDDIFEMYDFDEESKYSQAWVVRR